MCWEPAGLKILFVALNHHIEVHVDVYTHYTKRFSLHNTWFYWQHSMKHMVLYWLPVQERKHVECAAALLYDSHDFVWNNEFYDTTVCSIFYAVNFSRLTGNSLCVFRITQDCLLFAIPVSTLVIKDHHPNRSFVFCTKVWHQALIDHWSLS